MSNFEVIDPSKQEFKPPILTSSEKGSPAGKGDKVRPSFKPRIILDLRHDLIFGNQAQKQDARLQLKMLGDL